jgi:hypothetical protein
MYFNIHYFNMLFIKILILINNYNLILKIILKQNHIHVF